MKFIVDANLPRNFSFFNSEDFIHVTDIDPQMTDSELWQYAKNADLIILTKDSDFYYKSLLDENAARVVQFSLGNKTLSELHNYFRRFWPLILTSLPEARLIKAHEDRIVVVR
jgi:predicted nuclease of predicted toxin-antitoxin system